MGKQIPHGRAMMGAAVDACLAILPPYGNAPLTARPKPFTANAFPHDLIVAAVQREAVDVVSVVLVDPDGGPLPAWLPGDHVDLFLPSGRRRQYALCGDTGDRSAYRIAVRLMPHGNGGSIEIHEHLHSGDAVRVFGPHHKFPLVDAPEYLFIAGGIGIAPLLPMMRASGDRGTLVFVDRSRRSMPFLDLLPPASLHPVDELGLPDIPALIARTGPYTAVYVCGPSEMLSVTAHCLHRQNPSATLHIRCFNVGLDPADQPVAIGHPPHRAPHAD